jgi:hypothetical protein
MPSRFVPLAESCDYGPCPRFEIDPDTGDVLVQGYLTGELPSKPVPNGEGVVSIPAAAWQKLLTQLPR